MKLETGTMLEMQKYEKKNELQRNSIVWKSINATVPKVDQVK